MLISEKEHEIKNCQWCNKKLKKKYWVVIRKEGNMQYDFGIVVCKRCYQSRDSKTIWIFRIPLRPFFKKFFNKK